MKLSLVLLFSLLVLSASLALATTDLDRELEQCKHKCQVQRQYGPEGKRECVEKCEDYYREKKERQHEGEGGREGDSGWEEDERRIPATDPEKRLRQCQKQCERQEGQQRSLCRLRCQQKYGRESKNEEEEEPEPGKGRREEGEEEEHRGGKEDNPFVFEIENFAQKFETSQGKVFELENFAKRSELLSGLEKYRVGITEADPQAFVSPVHFDAEMVLFVAKGRGIIGLIREEKRESYNIECGDVIRVRAGTTMYLQNRDDNEKLYIIKFIQPVNIPGESEAFNSMSVEHRESFYKAFSWELLEAALKTDRKRIEQILETKQQAMVKASREQIQSLTPREHEGGGGGGIWPFGGQSSGSFNIQKEHPVQSNNYGQLFEAKPNDHKEQLKDLDLQISLAIINRGSMAGPFYNSKAITVSFVLDGEGEIEMACPHLSDSSSSGSKRRQSYQKVTSRLRTGKGFIALAGHPVALVASADKNLKIVSFEVNARGNTRYALAGKNNVVRQLERVAKELAFGAALREVDEVFGSQDEVWFFPGPRRQRREGRADA